VGKVNVEKVRSLKTEDGRSRRKFEDGRSRRKSEDGRRKFNL